MIEFLTECCAPVNLPFSLLMAAVVAYWLMVIVGVLGLDALDFDVDAGVDLDADIDVDGGIDTDVDGGSLFGDFLQFMHLGDVPVVIVGSFFVFTMWVVMMVSNHYLNPEYSWLMTGIFLIPNAIVSLLATKVVIMPFATLFKHERDPEQDRQEMIGQLGLVKTSEVTDQFGQVEVRQDGPPVVINARTLPGERLVQGDAARVVSYNQLPDTYLVELSKWEKK